MANWTNNNPTYYINPAHLTFVENSGYGPNFIQVSASSSCYISVYDPANGINFSDADKNYCRWKVTAYNNKFPDNRKWYIYVRLERRSSSGLVMYDTVERGVHGAELIEKVDEKGNVIKVEGEYDKENFPFFFIRIGEVSETNGTSIREITYDTGYLETKQGEQDSNSLNDMWELDKYSTPWLIRAKQWLKDFTLKGFLTVIGGFKLSKGKAGDEKIITDIKRSTDSDDEFLLTEDGKVIIDEYGNPIKNPEYVPVSDETIPTTAWVLGNTDGKYLRKDQDDRSVGNIASDKGVEVGTFVTGMIGGYGAKMYMDENEKSILEIDKIHAREELIVPTITFNTIEVVNGDKANTFAFGRIKDVEVLDDTHGIATLDLLEGEYGTVKAYDILRGVYHNIEGGNETETKEDGNGFMQYSGFFTSYFSPTIVESSKGRMVFRYVLQTGTTQRPVCPHPCAGMNFYAYGNFKDKDRQSITYETRDYRRRLVDMSTWGITPKNIVMQDGKLDNLTVGGFTMSGYGTFQTNSYFTGVQIQFTPDQLQEIKGEDSYAVTLSSYEGVLKIDGEGKVSKAVSQANVTVGGMNVTVTSIDGEKKNVVVTDFSLKTTIQASKGSTTLFYSEEPITGAYMASLRCIGCDGFISNGTVIITDVFDLEHCEVTISVSCEGKYPVEKTYRINAVYDGKIFEMETIYSKLQAPTPPADDVHPYKGEEWSEEFDKDMIWQATSNKKEDKWTPWVITRLKGFSYRISPESVSVGRTMTGSLSPDIIDFTCYKMMDDGKMEPTPAVWHVDKFRAGSWSAYGDYDSREVLTFQVPSSKNEESNKAYRVIARPTLEAEVSLVATVNMVDDGNTTLPRYRKEYDPKEQYVWNKEYRDIVIYNKQVWQVETYSEDGYITGVWDESKWTEASKYSFVAMDTALIDGANIAGFTFKSNKMVSGFADTSGNPTLVIDGQNGNIEAMKGRIGGFTITSGSLDGSWTDESGDAPVGYKGVTLAPDIIQIESNVSNVMMSPTGSAAIHATAEGKNAIQADGNVLINGDLTVTGKINGTAGEGGGGNVEIVEGSLPSLENLKPKVLYVVV